MNPAVTTEPGQVTLFFPSNPMAVCIWPSNRLAAREGTGIVSRLDPCEADKASVSGWHPF
jgi:hypothetical protein